MLCGVRIGVVVLCRYVMNVCVWLLRLCVWCAVGLVRCGWCVVWVCGWWLGECWCVDDVLVLTCVVGNASARYVAL